MRYVITLALLITVLSPCIAAHNLAGTPFVHSHRGASFTCPGPSCPLYRGEFCQGPIAAPYTRSFDVDADGWTNWALCASNGGVVDELEYVSTISFEKSLVCTTTGYCGAAEWWLNLDPDDHDALATPLNDPRTTLIQTDRDNDAASDRDELMAGADPGDGTSKPSTDDDGDGTPNAIEGGGYACTGGHVERVAGFVVGPACGGYGATTAPLVVQVGSSVFAWDATCYMFLQQCKNTTRYTANTSAPIEQPRPDDGYGWRRISGGTITNTTLTLPDGNSTDTDRDNVPTFRACDQVLTTFIGGTYTLGPKTNCRYLGPDSSDTDRNVPVPLNTYDAAQAELNRTLIDLQDTSNAVAGLTLNTTAWLIANVTATVQLVQGLVSEAGGNFTNQTAELVGLASGQGLALVNATYAATLQALGTIANATTTLVECVRQGATNYQANVMASASWFLANATPSNVQPLSNQVRTHFASLQGQWTDCTVSIIGFPLAQVLLDAAKKTTNATTEAALQVIQDGNNTATDVAFLLANTSSLVPLLVGAVANATVTAANLTLQAATLLRDNVFQFLASINLQDYVAAVMRDANQATRNQQQPPASTTQSSTAPGLVIPASNSLQGSDARAFIFILAAVLIGGTLVAVTSRRRG